MNSITKKIENNLKEFLVYTKDEVDSIYLKNNPFISIYNKNSVWPDISIIEDPLSLSEESFSILKNLIVKTDRLRVLVVNENLLSKENLDLLYNCGFKPTSFWVNMYNKNPKYKSLFQDLNVSLSINENINDWAKVVEACLFNNKFFNPNLIDKGIKSKKIYTLTLYKEDKPIASSLLFCGESAGIYMLGTLPEYRGLGIGRAILVETHNLALNLGYNKTVLQSTKEGLRLYKNLDFIEQEKLYLFYLNI